MATFLLAVIIFGSAAYVVYSRVKKGKSCEDCHTTCPVKKEQSEQ
ncbi:FeoB-associated Cys-rich membrane protein [Enterococcus faecalis]